VTIDTTDGPTDPSGRPEDLLHEFRLGRTEAGYELLGKQAPVKVWREVLHTLQERPNIDLELVAHRTLKRGPDVVSSLLDLAEAVGSATAAMVARGVASIRTEAPIVTRASALRDRLLEANDIEVLLAGDENVGALQALVAHDLDVQMPAFSALDEGAAAEVLAALDDEYQRLLELGRTVRWTSGSYRYFLRHAYADLALLAGVVGRTGDLAFRLLQQQVENPDENETLISLLPAETRARFLNWALERENLNQPPTRSRFVLRVAQRHLDDISADAVASAVDAKDTEVVLDALRLAVLHDPADNRFDAAIADAVNNAGEEEAASLLLFVVTRAPERLRADLLSASRRALLFGMVGESAEPVARQLAGAVVETRDPSAAEPLLLDIESLAAQGDVPDAVFDDLVDALYEMAQSKEPRARFLLQLGLGGQRFRRSLWNRLSTFDLEFRLQTFRTLLEVEDPDSAARETTDILCHSAPDADFLEAVVDGIEDGKLILNELDGIPNDVLRRLSEPAAVRLTAVVSELHAADDLIARGRPAAREEVSSAVAPLVAHAIERADGNDRLRASYRKLLIEEGAEEEVRSIVWPVEATDELVGLGGVVDAGASPPRVTLSGQDQSVRLRHLALLERRATSGPPERRAGYQLVLEAFASALGASGEAASAIADFLTGGPTFKTLFGVSAATRELLLRSAAANGLEVDSAWLEHPQFGAWVAEVLSPAGDTTHGSASDPITELAVQRRRLAEALEQAADLRHEARVAYIAEVRQGLDDLELTIDGYVQLWRRLARLGISQIAALGELIPREHIDPDRHELVGTATADLLVVRSAGVQVDGEVVIKARLEAETD
jgi:hypothetical protein